MRQLLGAIALLPLAVPAAAAPPIIFEATGAEKATGFRSMAECEAALGRPAATRTRASGDKQELRGTAFNRRAGNVSRCEMIDGEPLIVVYPTGRRARPLR